MPDSLHKKRAKNTYNKMKKQLEKLNQDVSFSEYVGFEMAMKIFMKNYKEWIN